jgi:hypothetical protein
MVTTVIFAFSAELDAKSRYRRASMMESGRNPCLGRSLVSFYWLGVIIAVVAINPPNRLVFQGDGTNQILAEDYGKRTSVIGVDPVKPDTRRVEIAA